MAITTCCAIAQQTPKSVEAVTKQVPTDQAAIKDQAEFLLKNVPASPLPAGSIKLDIMRKRAKALQEQHAAYAKDIASGNKVPFSHLRDARARHEQEVLVLRNHIGEISNEKDPKKRKIISKALFAALQPVGGFLEHASIGKGYTNLLSRDQQQELTRLERDWDIAGRDYAEDVAPLVTLGPGWLYTLTNLSAPITVKAPPSSTVLFRTHGGGFFSNKLSIIAVRANKEGIATAEWVTYGDSIADTTIGIRSIDAPPAHELIITTVQPKLRDLPEISQIPVKAPVKTPESIPSK
jgi:hypothetical protein